MSRATTMLRLAVPAVLALAFSACGADATPTAVPATSAPTATEASEAEVVLLAGDLRLEAGTCTTLEWRVDGALRAYIDGRGVDLTGSERVCPTESITYTLTAALADGSTVTRSQAITVISAATPVPPTAPPAATRPMQSPVPAATATPPATPTSAVSVDFRPDNNVYEIGKDDRCTAVVWSTAGVTGIELEREGMGRKAVGATGREEVCFGEHQVRFFLYYKLPDGREERRELVITRKS